MSTGQASVARVASSAALPKMRATFPLQVMGEMGLNNGDIWWMDPGELLFWCPELLLVGVDMRARIDFRNGRTIEVHLRLLQGEVPLRHEKGYLQLASWTAALADSKFALERLRETCPAVFKSDYRPPRLPALQETTTEAAPVRDPTEEELLAAQHKRDLAVEAAAMSRLLRRRNVVLRGAVAAGICLGVVMALALQTPSTLRWQAYQLNPELTVAQGLLRGVNFSGRDLAGAKLVGVDLEEAILAGASFRGSDLSRARLVSADLRRADLSFSNLGGAVLAGASLTGADLRGADVRAADLTGDTTETNFDGAIFSSATRWRDGKVAEGAVGPGALVSGRSFAKLVATGMDLSGADFSDSSMPNATFVGTKLVDVNLSGATIDGSDLSQATMTDAKMDRVSCKGCLLVGASLGQLTAIEGNFEGANFVDSHATSPKLHGANFAGAKFSKSRWGEADLQSADLRGADLSDVAWSRCVLSGANLGGAILSGANLTGCVSDGATVWPPGAAARNYGVLEIVAGGVAHGAVLPDGANWSGRDLHGLQGARMTAVSANWSTANLAGADLSNTSLGGGNFEGANLAGVNFAGANLASARFAGADLSGADLAQTDVCGADFAKASLGTTNFDRATACSKTQWPKNQPPKGITIR